MWFSITCHTIGCCNHRGIFLCLRFCFSRTIVYIVKFDATPIILNAAITQSKRNRGKLHSYYSFFFSRPRIISFLIRLSFVILLDLSVSFSIIEFLLFALWSYDSLNMSAYTFPYEANAVMADTFAYTTFFLSLFVYVGWDVKEFQIVWFSAVAIQIWASIANKLIVLFCYSYIKPTDVWIVAMF